MKAPLVFVVLALVASSAFCVSTISPWQAFWTESRHGGRIATCVEGNVFWGTYSGVGYLFGNISSDGTIASGNWYESGHVDEATGSFSFTLNSGQNGFTGVRKTQYIRCAPASWSETKITTASPSRLDCLRVYDNSQVALGISTIEGSYTSDIGTSLHICISPDGFYEVSSFDNNGVAYGTGYSRIGGVLGTGSFIDSTQVFSGSNSNQGIEMFILADPLLTNLGLNSNNGTVLYQIRYRGATDASDVDVSVQQPTVVIWQRSTVLPQSCTIQRSLLTSPWLGAWTDHDFGFGRLYVCQASNGRLRGVFSELGWIEGQISNDGRNVSGRFYDAGDTKQVSGDFSWTLVDPSHFSGEWMFDNSGHRYLWNETRVSIPPPFPQSQCMIPDSTVPIFGASLAGVWRYDTSPTADTLDICYSPDNTRFEASYNFNGGVDRGYITGFVREAGTALQGEWHESGQQGILTMFLTSSNTLRMLRWSHGDIQASYYYNCDDESGDISWMRHRNVAFTQRTSTTAKASSCARNADLITFAQPGPFVPNTFTDKYAVSYVAFTEPKKRNVFDFLKAMFSNDQDQDAENHQQDVQSSASTISYLLIINVIFSFVLVTIF